jgi:hypothetical protein
MKVFTVGEQVGGGGPLVAAQHSSGQLFVRLPAKSGGRLL